MNDRLSELIDCYFHGSLSGDEKRELAEALQLDAEARSAFAGYAQWSSGVGYALARLQKQAAERTTVKFPARSWKPAILAVAAAVLVALGITAVVQVGGAGPVVATVGSLYPAPQAGGRDLLASVVGPGGKAAPLRAGSTLRGGSSLRTGPGTCAQVRLSDGSVIDLNQGTELRFLPLGETACVSLTKGAVFCAISKGRPANVPFGVEMPGNRLITVLGTRFEAGIDAAGAVVRVEEGRVRLQTPTAARDAGPLQMVKSDASGSVSAPESIPLYEVAGWKFQSEQISNGAVLFQDDFEKGADQWEVLNAPASRMEVAEGKGTSGRRCLTLHLKPNAPMQVFAKVEIRHRNFEISCRFTVGPKAVRFGPTFRVPKAPGGDMTVEATTPSKRYGDFASGWVEFRALVRGTEVSEVWTQGGRVLKEMSGRIRTDYGYFKQVGLNAYGETEDVDLYIDDVVIKKLGD
jgi:ferric-dicitrate binding protein FerR (iron transport regulator)